MYEVIELKLAPGLDVKVKKYQTFISYFRSSEEPAGGEEHNRSVVIEVPDSGGKDIVLLRFLVGERITFRKSLAGLKIIRGLPDYTGKMMRVDLTDTLPGLVQERKDRHLRAQHQIQGYSSFIPQSNLCREIPLPSSVPTLEVSEAVRAQWEELSRMTRERMDNVFTEGVNRQALYDQTIRDRHTSTYRSIRDLYYTRTPQGIGMATGTVTGRQPGRTQPSHFEQWFTDFDGDFSYATLRNEEDRRFRTEMTRVHAEALPTRYANNQQEIAEITLADALRATSELAQGERAGPPQSRGPRPRNQRW